MSKVAIKIIGAKTGIPVIKFFPGSKSKEQYAVVDTGSEATVFDKGLGKNLILQDDKYAVSIHGMVKSGVKQFQSATVPMCIHSEKGELLILNAKGYATDMGELSLELEDGTTVTISSIIGSDMLTEYNAKIDYDKKVLTFTL